MPVTATTIRPVGPRRPVQSTTPAAAATNVASINGQNIRYSGANRQWGVDIAYLQADLVDLTPENPLSIWQFGSYKVNVKAGQVRMTTEQANTILKAQLGAGMPVTNASVAFLDNNRIQAKGTYHWGILPIPLSVKAEIATPTDTTIRVAPKSLRVFGLPVLWAVKAFDMDLSKYMPASGLATVGTGKAVTIDLKKTDLFEGKLSKIDITGGKAVVTIGGAPAPSLQGPRTRGVPNYVEVIARGEVALESAIIRNASIVTIDDTPEDPYSFNYWDVEGFARVESGDIILDEARLAAKFGGVGGAFTMKSAKLKGADLEVEGTYEYFGLPWPLSFKVNFSRTADGQLKLTPHSVRVVGLPFGQDTLMSAMSEVSGLKRSGDGFILDLRSAASVEMPPIRNLRTERGRIVLQP